jgi:hypothetical protein
MADGVYEVEGGTFAQLAGPPDFDDLRVTIDGVVVDSDLDAGESYYFAPDVTRFSVLNIVPAVDADNPTAFPTFLAFNGSPSELRMTALVAAVPEPETWALLLAGLAAVVGQRAKSAASPLATTGLAPIHRKAVAKVPSVSRARSCAEAFQARGRDFSW